VEVLNLARRFGLCVQGSSTFPWGSGPTVATLEYIVSSGLVAAPESPTWRGRVLFTARLVIAAQAPCLRTVVRGTPDSGYRHNGLHLRSRGGALLQVDNMFGVFDHKFKAHKLANYFFGRHMFISRVSTD
jgi:hypothetical protein